MAHTLATSEQSFKNNNLYFAESTHHDTVCCALGVAYSAKKQLPAGFDIVPARLGTDFLKRNFATSCSKNAHAMAQGIDGQMANVSGALLQNFQKLGKLTLEKKQCLCGQK